MRRIVTGNFRPIICFQFTEREHTDVVMGLDLAINELEEHTIDAEFVTCAKQLSRPDQIKLAERLKNIRAVLVS